MLVAKTYLKWNEPRVIRQAVRRASAAALTTRQKLLLRLGRPCLVVCIAAIMMPFWLLGRKYPLPHEHAPPLWAAVLLALSLGVFLTYVVPWLNRLCPSSIKVRGDGILRQTAYGVTVWKYRDMSGYNISPFQTDAGEASVLAIIKHKGKTVYIGIPESVPLGELERVLSERGVVVTES
jgi:hypothetical protein